MQDYNNIRLVQSKGKEILQVKDPTRKNSDWYTIKNTTEAEDLEDIRQFRSILPKFIHPYLKDNYNL